ncbi:isocitrate lyase/PEP mutase family protein [Algicella marina]|uniref:Isocitrate lyase/phosphoenolpyruvate mutase family protein n=1 Tax=Algicella marina TaxID=2683284 RepID=A0A6P1T6J7_9RHOB|nr:isocitrate lyase/phosphoenolpyruvate mutase family protein [Algicella marina]QHQ37116.1 isocitrate lyase/phosphoenolpyruvate mutase family protein [Algicella marina]
MSISERARTFAALHIPGNPLHLVNVWDAGSAQAVETAGAKAIATGSWAVAAAQGHHDGQSLPLDLMLAISSRITSATALPVTLDFEGGYADTPEDLARNTERLLTTGAVGLNFEDQVIGGTGLHPIPAQATRIAVVRRVADTTGIPLFINARCDLFFQSGPAAHKGQIEEALRRAEAYAEAGASGFFTPGLSDPKLIERLAAACPLPLNIMTGRESPIASELANAGVARISHGPAPYLAAMSFVTAEARGHLSTA